ncbi:uncharacterized protein LOC127291705 [Leptopilina boulardi]|uniref:uncharacterized protein LOC127291705 n=1 Tax=Leptopilina boulardi TaxID=63433 RepID=UPI0021F5F3A9|nr:uncharacterized protein LOC127291705 [Leptopilina boulardi]
MYTLFSQSPLAYVQLIPIFNYLNLLSDFLYTENKLESYNQHKQIPIVNALYAYLEDYNDNNQAMLIKLIQNLLKGSDLYGEEDNENVDGIFVNTMFEYIISSLVFDKYGNIYGFLVDTIRKLENFQYDYVLSVIKETLQNATFENECGLKSNLSELAVNRIYTDIILPIFPKSKTNINILSLDYIFAQAGSTYLRLGKINDSYSSNFMKNNFACFQNGLFDEYVIVGNIVWNLIQDMKIDPLTVRVFALPALLYYTTTEDKVKYDMITNVIFNPHHWEAAYHKFFDYLNNAYNQIEHQLQNDYTYKIHLEFSNFQSRDAIAKSIIDSNCMFLIEEQRKNKTFPHVQLEHFECTPKVISPYINDWYNDQIHTLGEIYENYDLQIIKQCFNESLVADLNGITIKLIVNNNDTVNGSFNNLQYLSHDLLEFVYTDNKTSKYYILIRENYTATLIKVVDKFFNELIRLGKRIILKFANEGANEFYEELTKYKKQRFKSHFTLLNYNLKNNEWWKEFGLSLVPFYSCLSKSINYDNKKENLCENDNIKFLNQFSEDISSEIINLNTRSLLSIYGIDIKSFFLKKLITKTYALVVSQNNVSKFSTQNNTFYEQFSLHVEEPKFETISITEEGIKLVSMIISKLKEKINYNFTCIVYMLNKIEFLKHSFIRNISDIGENRSKKLLVNTLNNNTGYGYKFINIYNSTIASLRTDYEFKNKIFITLVFDFPQKRKKFIKLNNETFVQESNYFIYEINNQLRRKKTILKFSGIWNNHINEKCLNNEYLQLTKHSNDCLRYWRFVKQFKLKEGAVNLLKNKVHINGDHMASEEEIRNELKKYTFPDDPTFFVYFVSRWLISKKFEESNWSKSCIIDNSDILNKLRFDLLLENNNVTIADGKNRINLIYTYRERCKIEEETSIAKIIYDFNDQKAGFSVTFEDYYAIRNFVTSGDTRISGDTNEAKQMKLALYKLAIRQSDDLREEFDWKLYRFESIPINIASKKFIVGKRVIFQKFTLTSTNVISATRFSSYSARGFRNILYEIEFTDPYFRATINTKVERFEPVNEKNVILLPGSEFEIKSITIVQMRGLGYFFKVLLNVPSKGKIGKYEHYKYLMSEITKNKF